MLVSDIVRSQCARGYTITAEKRGKLLSRVQTFSIYMVVLQVMSENTVEHIVIHQPAGYLVWAAPRAVRVAKSPDRTVCVVVTTTIYTMRHPTIMRDAVPGLTIDARAMGLNGFNGPPLSGRSSKYTITFGLVNQFSRSRTTMYIDSM